MPTHRHSGVSGNSARSSRSVSTVYDGPARAHLAIVDDEARLIATGRAHELEAQSRIDPWRIAVRRIARRARSAFRRGAAPAAIRTQCAGGRSESGRTCRRRCRAVPSSKLRCHAAASGTPAMRATRPESSTHASPRRLPLATRSARAAARSSGFDVAAAQPLDCDAHRSLPVATRPASRAQDAVEVASSLGSRWSTRDSGAQVVDQRPEDQRRFDAFTAQAVEDAQGARRVAEERRGRRVRTRRSARCRRRVRRPRRHRASCRPGSAARCARSPAAPRAGCPRRDRRAVAPRPSSSVTPRCLQTARDPRRAAARARPADATTTSPRFSNSLTHADFCDLGSSSPRHEQHRVGGRRRRRAGRGSSTRRRRAHCAASVRSAAGWRTARGCSRPSSSASQSKPRSMKCTSRSP